MSDPSTFELAKQAANELFDDNIKPSVNKIREKLNGKGGQQTIQNALDEWWVELQATLKNYQQREDIPEHLFQLTDQLWTRAISASEKKHTNDVENFTIQAEQQRQAIQLEKAQHEATKQSLQESTRAAIKLKEELKSQKEYHEKKHSEWNDDILAMTLESTQEEHKRALLTLSLSNEKEKAEQQKNHYEKLLADTKKESEQQKIAIEELTKKLFKLQSEADAALSSKKSSEELLQEKKGIIEQLNILVKNMQSAT